MEIRTNTNTILLSNIRNTYLITNTGDTLDISGAHIEYERTNEIYNTKYTTSLDISHIRNYQIGDIKKVRKDKIDLSSKHAFYISQGNINSWEKYISYDLYFTPNELEIVSVSEREKDMGSDQKHIYKVYRIKAKSFSLIVSNAHSKVVSGTEIIEYGDREIDLIEDIIKRMKESPIAHKRTSQIATLEEYLKQGKKYIVHHTRNEPLPQEFDLVVFDRTEYGKDYKRREKLANELNEFIYGKTLSVYDIERIEDAGYKITKKHK